MPAKKNATPRYKRGDKVKWPYRGATGYGTISGVSKPATKGENIMYSIRVAARHPGEPPVRRHRQDVLRAWSGSLPQKEKARMAQQRRRK